MIDGILEFTYRPVANKRIANALFFALLAISVIPVVLSVTMDRYKGLISLAAVALFVAAILIYSRYIAAEYAYVVMYSGDAPMLIVTKTIGKRVTTLLSVALSDVVSVVKRDSKESKSAGTGSVKKYNFSVSLKPSSTYIILAKTRYESIRVTLEGSDDFAHRIEAYATLARAYEAEHTDDEY